MPNNERVQIEPAFEALQAGRETFAHLTGLHGKELVGEVHELSPEQLRRVRRLPFPGDSPSGRPWYRPEYIPGRFGCRG